MDPPKTLEQVSKMIIYALSFYMISFEVLQMKDFGLHYFASMINWVDQVSTFFILGILIKNDFFPDKLYSIRYESLVSTIAVGFTWYKVFYFMKLFETTAFFINLLSHTFLDKNFKAFMIMTIILVLCFSNLLYILNTERGAEFRFIEDESIINDSIY